MLNLNVGTEIFESDSWMEKLNNKIRSYTLFRSFTRQMLQLYKMYFNKSYTPEREGLD